MADASGPPHSTSGGGGMGASKNFEPVSIRFLNTMEAFNKSKPIGPSYSIAAKLPNESTRGRVNTEVGPDIGQKLDVARASQPKWSIQGRWKAQKEIDEVPAPGHYRNPSTLDKSHPTMKCSGRGWSMEGTDRPSMAVAKDGPGPDAYRDDRKDFAMNKEPSWSIYGRDSYDKKKQPALFQTNSEPNLLRDTSGFHHKGGLFKTPEWKFTSRPASTLIPSGGAVESPGPANTRGKAESERAPLLWEGSNEPLAMGLGHPQDSK
eukprot:CAMPEP_0206436888 /NCGR_PEP_ID=MMETSP0324_2-20121206/10735_1 /ASSEMBLY_ACC=CAM_ASM_000836 /TAXON_ID=2866 /ORGANISM="Crypthecodinium cohnii, Strain Seligo" /LENGTH=262 /DNA_ID=CAMNT_0053904107 /DNA_START=162 /DNA_END=948 /DNA_ORIENTATION=+